ncbi:hypothetical protein Q9R32_13495 [Actinotalea sp. AC32]|nr:hypothetical protein [Actinotalea sp. AC32]
MTTTPPSDRREPVPPTEARVVDGPGTGTGTGPDPAGDGAREQPVAGVLAGSVVTVVGALVVAAAIGYHRMLVALSVTSGSYDIGTASFDRWTGVLLLLCGIAVVAGLWSLWDALHRLASRSDRSVGLVPRPPWWSRL